MVSRTLTWGLLTAVITTGLVWWTTEDWNDATTVGLLDTASKALVYFVFERCWPAVREEEDVEGEGERELQMEMEVLHLHSQQQFASPNHV